MTKEFPELTDMYKKLIGNQLFHEEYVLAEFMKNANKWDEADLLNDLNFININLRDPRNLDRVDLEYFKTWKIEEQIQNIH